MVAVRFLICVAIAACWVPGPAPPPPPAKPRSVGPLPKGPYATVELRGPSRSIAAWCEDVEARLKVHEQDGPVGCSTHPRIVTSGATRIAGATNLLEARLVAVDGREALPRFVEPKTSSDLLSDELEVFGRDRVYEEAVRSFLPDPT